jgi:hypothetical protein
MSLLLRSLMFPVFLSIGLLAPGWLLGRALRTPAGLLGAFLGSSVLLMNLLLVIDALNLRLTAPNVAIGLGIVCGILAGLAKWRAQSAVSTFPLWWRGFRGQAHHWLLIPAAIGLGIVMLKTALDPLAGGDTKFRWNFLALQMLREGNLHFYPAFSASDFMHYAWCDGIAPLVSSLYFWGYLSLDHAAPWATTPIVIGQAILLFRAVYELATLRRGPAAGWTAMGILATSCVLLSAVAIGQETGLTALSLVAMFLFIERHRETPGGHWLVWAGISAAAGGLAREYGLVYCVLGAVTLACYRTPVRAIASFVITTLAVAAPWYLRNWIKTGNPLYSHELAGLFPANPINTEYIQAIEGFLGSGTNPQGLRTLMMLTATLCGVPVALGLIGCARYLRQLWPWLMASAVLTILWLWSVGQTSGGYAYSLRVLAPALALAAVCGGMLLARWAGSSRSWILALLLCLPAVDAAERVLFMPFNPMISWWRESPLAWLTIRDNVTHWDRDPNWAAIAEAANGKLIVTTDPFCHALLVALGARAVPFFSPAVRFLFEPDARLNPTRARLRDAGFRFVMMPPKSAAITRFQLSQHPFFQMLQATPPTASTLSYLLYDVYASDLPSPDRPPTGSAVLPHAP